MENDNSDKIKENKKKSHKNSNKWVVGALKRHYVDVAFLWCVLVMLGIDRS